ncbi:MAG: efflux transporter outer membrane subunit [Flavobacterium sp.]|nr:efflux transporter outer membrane subunit [Flavobacterium sp.]
MKNKLIFGFVVMLLLASCKVGPSYNRPNLDTPNLFLNTKQQSENESVANIKWFSLFNDPALTALIQKGIENNYDLKIALTRLDQAKAVLGITKANLLPSLGYSATVNRPESFSNPSTAFGTLNWELDFFGKIRSEKGALQNELLATDEARKAVLSELVAQIASTYFNLRDFDNRLRITQRTVESRKASYDIVVKRFEKGYVSELDKVQIEQQVALAEGTLQQIIREITYLENALQLLTAQVPGIINRGPDNSGLIENLELPSSIPANLLENRPDVKKAELAYKAAVDRIGVAKAMQYPSFNILAFAGYAQSDLSKMFEPSSFTKNAAASITGNVFAFGKNKRRVALYKSLATEAELQFRKTFLTALTEVENALVQLKTFKAEWVAADKQTRAAQQYLKLSQARYEAGYVSYLEVLDAERSLFSSELNRSYLTQQKQIATVQLYKALGGGWQN